MKSGVVILVILAVILVSPFIVIQQINFFQSGFGGLTGFVSQQGSPANTGEIPQFGPSASDQACMKKCVTDAGCTIGDVACSEKNSCMIQCNVKKPEVTEENSCMEKCVTKDCGEFDFSCQQKNQAVCEEECNMIKEPEAKSEEEQCIRDCVKSHAPGTICKPSQEGEQGNDVCQMCAQQCVHLYKGPCLNDEKLKAKQKECETCEHCYGKPVMGDSGEGWDCIVDIECNDASSEFGDNPGSGPGIAKAVGDTIGGIGEGIANFFKGIFGGGEINSNDDRSDRSE